MEVHRRSSMSHFKGEHKCTAGFYAICILKQESYKVVGKVGNERAKNLEG